MIHRIEIAEIPSVPKNDLPIKAGRFFSERKILLWNGAG